MIENLNGALKEAEIYENTKINRVESQLHMNDIPQDFFIIQYNSKEVYSNAIKKAA